MTQGDCIARAIQNSHILKLMLVSDPRRFFQQHSQSYSKTTQTNLMLLSDPRGLLQQHTATDFSKKKRASKRVCLLVTIPKATELLLSSSIPAVETDLATVCEEIQRMNLHTNGSCNTTPQKLNQSENSV